MSGGTRHPGTLRKDARVQKLLVLFGDQLDRDGAGLRALDPERDAVLMMEVLRESQHVPSSKQRTVVFLAAMRHFALELEQRGVRVHYVSLDEADNRQNLSDEVARACERLSPRELLTVHPGEWRVLQMIADWRDSLGVPVTMLDDEHFYLTPAEFGKWAEGKKSLLLEFFYRNMRRRFDVLMDGDDPEGGQWNFDKHNRERFKRDQPPPRPVFSEPDAITRDVIRMVQRHLPDAPGRIDKFVWPVTRRSALRALRKFIEQRLPDFGQYQDAMVADEPWMFHSVISAPLNLKLLNPREVVAAALKAYERGHAPLNSVEGFVRQIIGWREFIRGVYWHCGSDYCDRNALNMHGDLPWMYWTGETDMNCMKQSLGQVLDYGYGHHIQRLMVTGNFALLCGVEPRAISDWYLGMYVDGVDWVTLPNTVGMVMHADGGVVGTKPYAASGQYIKRMSDYCDGCRYNPKQRTGDEACPFTTLYWDFLLRNEGRLRGNNRMAMILTNVDRMDAEERRAIQRQADALRQSLKIGDIRQA